MCDWTWEQEHDEIIITIKTAAVKDDVRVEPTSTTLKVYIKDELILDRVFSKHIVPSEIIWYIDEGLILQLNKKTNEWWDCVFEGDEKIDVNEIASTRSLGMENLDDEAKVAVEKMMYEQKCKSSGVESEEEKQKREIMEMIQKNSKEEEDK